MIFFREMQYFQEWMKETVANLNELMPISALQKEITEYLPESNALTIINNLKIVINMQSWIPQFKDLLMQLRNIFVNYDPHFADCCIEIDKVIPQLDFNAFLEEKKFQVRLAKANKLHKDVIGKLVKELMSWKSLDKSGYYEEIMKKRCTFLLTLI